MAEKYKDSTLAPHAGKMTETPASDIPIGKLKAPPGFKVEVWASGLPGGRAMALSDDGKKVYVGTRGIGRVYEVTDTGDKRTVRTVVDKLTQPAGVAYKNGALYVFAIDKALKYDGIVGNPNVQPQDLTADFRVATTAAPQLEIHRLRPGRQAVRAIRLAVQYLRASKGIRARSGATTPTARARKSSPPECATRSASTGTRRPRNYGSPTTAATGWATTARLMS